jgi:hypothetical protein
MCVDQLPTANDSIVQTARDFRNTACANQWFAHPLNMPTGNFKRISCKEKCVISHLFHATNFIPNREIYTSLHNISTATNISSRTVRRALNRAVEYGWIVMRKRPHGLSIATAKPKQFFKADASLMPLITHDPAAYVLMQAIINKCNAERTLDIEASEGWFVGCGIPKSSYKKSLNLLASQQVITVQSKSGRYNIQLRYVPSFVRERVAKIIPFETTSVWPKFDVVCGQNSTSCVAKIEPSETHECVAKIDAFAPAENALDFAECVAKIEPVCGQNSTECVAKIIKPISQEDPAESAPRTYARINPVKIEENYKKEQTNKKDITTGARPPDAEVVRSSFDRKMESGRSAKWAEWENSDAKKIYISHDWDNRFPEDEVFTLWRKHGDDKIIPALQMVYDWSLTKRVECYAAALTNVIKNFNLSRIQERPAPVPPLEITKMLRQFVADNQSKLDQMGMTVFFNLGWAIVNWDTWAMDIKLDDPRAIDKFHELKEKVDNYKPLFFYTDEITGERYGTYTR